jgi:hypothetical protein
MNEIETTETIGNVALAIMRDTLQMMSALGTQRFYAIVIGAGIIAAAILAHAFIHGLLTRGRTRS